MNLPQYDAHYPDGFCITRPQMTLVCPDHELICLGFEEALKRGWDAEYGAEPSDTHNHYLEVYDCSLDEFCSILDAAKAQKEAPRQYALPLDALHAIGGAA